jgi:putative component of membrane protein insertase Oxa1/YidC/SpoIIIJ protein YidD
MRRLALTAIRLYQRYVSPRKGFACAYRGHTGRASCSVFGFRAVRRRGLIRGVLLIRARTRLCGEVHRRHSTVSALRRLNAQRGVCDVACDVPSCDLPCDGHCDLPSGRSLSDVGDVFSFCDCGSWDRAARGQERRRSGCTWG